MLEEAEEAGGFEEFMVLPRLPAHPRPEAAMSLAMVNVISAGITETQPRRTKFDGGGRTKLGPTLEVVAWVHDVGYEKDVWIDLYLFDAAATLIGSEMLRLDYQGLAGGEGGLFALSAPIPPRPPAGPGSDAAMLQYRLYYRVNDAVFTDGILHAHHLPHPDHTANGSGPAEAGADGRVGS